MRSPVAMSNGCAPVLASYSAITLLTSSMSAVAGSYSRSLVSPWDENVTILAIMLGLLRDVHLRSSVEQQSAEFGSLRSYCSVFQSCQCATGIPARTLKNQTDMKTSSWSECPRLDTRAAQLFLDVVAWNGMAPGSRSAPARCPARRRRKVWAS